MNEVVSADSRIVDETDNVVITGVSVLVVKAHVVVSKPFTVIKEDIVKVVGFVGYRMVEKAVQKAVTKKQHYGSSQVLL